MAHDPAASAPWTDGRETQSKVGMYQELGQALVHLLEGESDIVAAAANTAAAVFHTLPHLNWAGFYMVHGDQLVLGPFQGRPACVRIPFGKGVCGTAAAQRRSVLVPDVTAFPGHIACDLASRSELVVPLLHQDRLICVLDLDSPYPGRFDEVDQTGCEALAVVIAPFLA